MLCIGHNIEQALLSLEVQAAIYHVKHSISLSLEVFKYAPKCVY